MKSEEIIKHQYELKIKQKEDYEKSLKAKIDAFQKGRELEELGVMLENEEMKELLKFQTRKNKLQQREIKELKELVERLKIYVRYYEPNNVLLNK